MKTTLTAALASLIMATASAGAFASSADTPIPIYALQARVAGTQIKQDVVTGDTPFDKTFEQLTPDQKAVLKAGYPNITAADDPPFPLLGLAHALVPVYTFALNMIVSGDLVVYVDVNADGNPTSAVAVKAPDPELGKLAAIAFMAEKFKPATCSGAPCKMAFKLNVSLLDPRR